MSSRALRMLGLSLAWGIGSCAPGLAVGQTCLESPIESPLITSNFGMRFHPTLKIWRAHNGADFRASMFTRVKAAQSGVVAYAGWISGGGNAVFVLADNGIQTRYAHLSRVFVSTGQRVEAGRVVGDSGSSGEASAGPHLHFETRANGGSAPTDPRAYLCSQPAVKPGAGPEGYQAQEAANGTANPPIGDGSNRGLVPTSAAISTMEGMSLVEFLRMEGERRFLNQQWHREILDPLNAFKNDPANAGQPVNPGTASKTLLYREIAIMLALDAYMGYQKKLSRERIEAMLATLTAQRVKQHHAEKNAGGGR